MSEMDARGSAQLDSRRGPSVLAVFTSHWLSMLGLGLVLTGIIAWVGDELTNT